ncbi:MAG: alpha-hydroxy acid oxidase, partial [Pseudomonadota bacterium]
GLSVPPKLNARNAAGFFSRPGWCMRYLFSEPFRLSSIPPEASGGDTDISSVIKCISTLFERRLTWRDIEWIAREWGGPLAVKGVLSGEDAKTAVSCGASTVMVSNHGGRQLGAAIAPFEALPRIADAVGGRAEIIVDGGIRRGTHIIKALALGADACCIGRPYLYGLAAGGEAGVLRAIELLRDELERSMALLGCTQLSYISEQHIDDVSRGNGDQLPAAFTASA